MLHNQGKLSKVDATKYRPSDPREMPLIDESLIYGYDALTGERISVEDTIARLNHDGMQIRRFESFCKTDGSQEYNFPTRI